MLRLPEGSWRSGPANGTTLGQAPVRLHRGGAVGLPNRPRARDDPRGMMRSVSLGRLLVDTGVLTQAILEETLAIQKTDRRRLGELLVERGVVHPQELAQLLSHQMSCPWISLAHLDIAPEILSLLPRSLALEHAVVPVHLRMYKGHKVLYVATDDPTDDVALDECGMAAKMAVRPMVAVSVEVRAALARFYGGELPATPVPPKVATKPAAVPTSKRTSIRESIEETEILELEEEPPSEKRSPTILVLNAPPAFLVECKEATKSLSATLVGGQISSAAELVAEHRPCAIVVTDDVYAFDRSGLNRLALDNDAHLVVWSEEVGGRQLEPLLAGAISRWGRSSYEKGAIVDGRYELMRDLSDESNRGTGSRWEVRNVRTARRSLLALAVRADDGEENAVAIRREQRALARVTHPGAVELRDAGTTELGDPYIVLEPIEGRTLDGLVVARTRLISDDVCAIVLQVADVLAAAHAVGVVHRDVAAENILVARDGYGLEHVKLTSWGHATTSDVSLDEVRVDLSALGVCAFLALTGRTPKPEEDVESAGIPQPLATVVARALASDATAFESMKDLAAALLEAAPSSRQRTQLLDASPLARDESLGPPPPSPGADQRRYARAPYRTPVRIEVPGIGAVDGRTEDISGGGLLVVSRGSLKEGTEVTVRFALPLDGRVVSEAAVVKWSRAPTPDESSGLCAIGVAISETSAETQRQIERYVSLMGDGTESTFAR
jgi:hypothetical protein